jgi:Domain of unknown function (DUF6504)
VAHRYGGLIQVDSIWVDGEREVRAFTWRGRRYQVAEMLGSWHLQTRWWDRERHSDRTYYPVQTPDFQVLELYHERLSDAWVLDVVQD